ncbi:S8 family peptidase [Romboutsia sp.]|uniref:S8 family peptidase n=1 Tax=Romboutsia sp. TaxID=1965302 RepID=UPI003F3E889D
MEDNIKLVPFSNEGVVTDLAYTIPYGVNLINAPAIWNKGYTGKGVTIAIIDTGCDTKHPALSGSIIGGKNFTTDDKSNPNIYEDYQGHGTHVAGTIAANTNNVGITGVAPNANLLILKALDKNGSGSITSIINAINYAIQQKVDIISMSLGGPSDVKALHDAVVLAINQNILVVCAAGNRGDNGNPNTDEFDYPGAYDEVVEVGAIDKNKNIAPFTDSNKFVDVVAPGVAILSTYKNQSYATLSGTSMATPHVTGALALLIEWSIKEFGRKLTESEYYAQLVKCTNTLNYARTLQGNGYVYLNMYNTK